MKVFLSFCKLFISNLFVMRFRNHFIKYIIANVVLIFFFVHIEGTVMRNKICLALGLTLSFVAGVSAQTTTYKITKVGSEENQSIDVLLNGKFITEAKQGDWPNVSPIVPDGKMFIGFTVYEEYGETREDQKELTVGRNGLRFLMPKKDVFVKVSYESLRYSIKANSAENGSVSFSFNDRVEMTDRTKPGNKVTVSPKADKGYKVSSIKVSKYLDPNTTVTCTAASGAGHAGPGAIPGATAAEGSCSFEMPNFDVDITATFVDEKTDVPKVDLKGKKFSINYKLNEGKLPKDAAESYSCESEATLPIPTRDGFDFVGWSWTNKLDNIYYAVKTLDGTRCADTTLYAIWTPKGSCMEQKAVAVDSAARMPVCSSNIRCALIHSNTTKQDSVCNGIVWTTDMSILSSSSSVVSSSSVAASSSSAKPASSSVAASSSSAKPASSSVAASSSSAKPASSSVAASSSSAKPASSSVAASSSSAKPASSSVAASSSSAKPASSSAKATSSSTKAASSSSKAKSSSSVEVVVESVKTEEDLPNCTSKRENVTYYVSELKKVFVCKDKKWTAFDPNGLPTIARVAKFSAVANGHMLQITGAKMGASVSLFYMQGSVMYNGRVDVPNFTMSIPRSGSYLLRIGSQQKIVNIR